MPGISLRPEPAHPVPGAFDRLTVLELTALSVRLRRGRNRARQAALRSRSPLEIWDMVKLGALLAGLEDEVIQALARHYSSRSGSRGHGSSSARALLMASSMSRARDR